MASRSFPILWALVASLTCLNACSVQYSAASITAKVVDAESGQPVAGVYVVAHWQLYGGLEGGNDLGAVMVLETQTDNSGQFQFPAWGPKQVSMPSGVYSNARVKNGAPAMLFFKSGYASQRVLNYGNSELAPGNMRSDWDGKVIKLEPFHGNSAQYAKSLSDLSSYLESSTAGSGGCKAGEPCPSRCQWQHTPNMIRAIGRQFKSFEAEGMVDSSIFSQLVINSDAYQRMGCPSPAMILGGDGR
jgi:hypothetical protein